MNCEGAQSHGACMCFAKIPHNAPNRMRLTNESIWCLSAESSAVAASPMTAFAATVASAGETSGPRGGGSREISTPSAGAMASCIVCPAFIPRLRTRRRSSSVSIGRLPWRTLIAFKASSGIRRSRADRTDCKGESDSVRGTFSIFRRGPESSSNARTGRSMKRLSDALWTEEQSGWIEVRRGACGERRRKP